EVRNALAYVLLNARKHYRQRRGRKPPVVLDGASSGLWFDGWKGRSPPRLGKYADALRRCEVAAARTWLLEKGWRRIGLVDPAEVPGTWRRRRGCYRLILSWLARRGSGRELKRIVLPARSANAHRSHTAAPLENRGGASRIPPLFVYGTF
ncbi:MAG: hypothetical protein OXH68_17275, partial [Gammaproteobacteria bacterium]|nr:hypothetical protein [Gammaproteobacteria bacterium]